MMYVQMVYFGEASGREFDRAFPAVHAYLMLQRNVTPRETICT